VLWYGFISNVFHIDVQSETHGFSTAFCAFFQLHAISRLSPGTCSLTYTTYDGNSMKKNKKRKKQHVFVMGIAQTLTLLTLQE